MSKPTGKLAFAYQSIAYLEQQNQQLKQRIEQLEKIEWEMEAIQALFSTENDDCLIEPFNSENLFKWLNRNDIEQQEKGVNHIGAVLTGMGFCGVESLCEKAIEQLHKGVE